MPIELFRGQSPVFGKTNYTTSPIHPPQPRIHARQNCLPAVRSSRPYPVIATGPDYLSLPTFATPQQAFGRPPAATKRPLHILPGKTLSLGFSGRMGITSLDIPDPPTPVRDFIALEKRGQQGRIEGRFKTQKIRPCFSTRPENEELKETSMSEEEPYLAVGLKSFSQERHLVTSGRLVSQSFSHSTSSGP